MAFKNPEEVHALEAETPESWPRRKILIRLKLKSTRHLLPRLCVMFYPTKTKIKINLSSTLSCVYSRMFLLAIVYRYIFIAMQ